LFFNAWVYLYPEAVERGEGKDNGLKSPKNQAKPVKRLIHSNRMFKYANRTVEKRVPKATKI